ncbi:uncharacterized protein LOC125707600 [Brienomyrus brachyistius]|uniref:uncharacterized protein LOC125707600 n=1 Tax=Brienomyrus brachyistius TaxID=42636 RepID=UPI0020B1B7F3|nr:uncharacterized protein LOC125707600 [Brienomyrus brachyistius]
MRTFYSMLYTETPNSKYYFRDHISFEQILSVKEELKRNNLLEPVLSSNLDFAARALGKVHPSCLSRASLLISGDSLVVKMYLELVPDSNMHFAVTVEGGLPVLRQLIVCGKIISKADIKDVHFFGHRCQDETISCQEQALNLTGNGLERAELRIHCNKLHLTYTVEDDDEDGDKEDLRIVSLQTNCKLGTVCTLEALMNVKSWLEQEKPEKIGLIACMEHLLRQYRAPPSTPVSYRFVLQSDGETVEIFPTGRTSRYIFGDKRSVSMCPANPK